MRYSDGALLDMLLELDEEEIELVFAEYQKKHMGECRLGLSGLCYQALAIKQDKKDRAYMADLIQKVKAEKESSPG